VRNSHLIGLVGCIGVSAGCAMSMSASQFYTEFAAATQSLYLTGADAEVAFIDGSCINLDEHRYTVPIGLTVYDEVRNGGKGVDTIVADDGGNAYRISGYAWVPAGEGATQLQVDFETWICGVTQDVGKEPNTTTI
jgi:hypothetical protein